jgi:hypothetical protein
VTLSIEVSGGGRRLGFSFAEAAAEWAKEANPLAMEALRQAAPVGQGPGAGHLRDSISDDQEITESAATITFTADVSYASYVVDGTVPHLIQPRNVQALHWTGPNGSVFAKVVHHPGTRPDDFAARALTPLIPLFQGALEAAISEQLAAGTDE